MTVAPRDRTYFIEEAIAEPFTTRDVVASEYAAGLIYGREATNWTRVNAAILGRWSPAGLAYIKRRAWKMVERRSGA